MFNKLKYFTKKGVEPSHAEALIIYFLTKWRIPYLREVSFENLKSNKGGYYRFDFYFPDKDLIIEYDGAKWHKNPAKDNIKDNFCKKNGIRVIRFNKKHYYSLEKHLLKLLTKR